MEELNTKNLIHSLEDKDLIEKIIEIYSINKIKLNYLLSKYYNSKYKPHTNAVSWYCQILWNSKDQGYQLIPMAISYFKEKYDINFSDYISEIISSMGADEIGPYLATKTLVNSLFSMKDSCLSVRDIVDKSIEEVEKEKKNYRVNSALETPIMNLKTKNSMYKEDTILIEEVLKKNTWLYYITTKIDGVHNIIYIGSGNINRIRSQRENEFIKEFVNNIPNCNRKLYLIPVKNYTLQFAREKEKTRIREFKKQGFLLANKLYYDKIKDEELTDINKMNRLMRENNISKKVLNAYKIECIKKLNFKTLSDLNQYELDKFEI